MAPLHTRTNAPRGTDSRDSSDKEVAERESAFLQSFRFVHTKNRQLKASKSSMRLAINRFADMLPAERVSFCVILSLPANDLFCAAAAVIVVQKIRAGVGMRRPKVQDNGAAHLFEATKAKEDLPKSMNWTALGAVTPVKDQGICGSCWSFGTTGTLEGSHFVKTGNLVPLSQQELMDCSWNFGNNACDGGEDFRAYQCQCLSPATPTRCCSTLTGCYVAALLLCHRDHAEWRPCYFCFLRPLPHAGRLVWREPHGFAGALQCIECFASCHDSLAYPLACCVAFLSFTLLQTGVVLESYTNVTMNDETALMQAIAEKGPISVSIDASLQSFSYYGSGVFYDPECKNGVNDLDHSVLAVGYGTENGEDYWLIKNSWSTHWVSAIAPSHAVQLILVPCGFGNVLVCRVTMGMSRFPARTTIAAWPHSQPLLL